MSWLDTQPHSDFGPSVTVSGTLFMLLALYSVALIYCVTRDEFIEGLEAAHTIGASGTAKEVAENEAETFDRRRRVGERL